jgi:hypothetical protein
MFVLNVHYSNKNSSGGYTSLRSYKCKYVLILNKMDIAYFKYFDYERT